MKTQANEPINPCSEDKPTGDGFYSTIPYIGLTKREYFAGIAMQGILSSPAFSKLLEAIPAHKAHDLTISIAKDAVTNADYLIKQLNDATKGNH